MDSFCVILKGFPRRMHHDDVVRYTKEKAKVAICKIADGPTDNTPTRSWIVLLCSGSDQEKCVQYMNNAVLTYMSQTFLTEVSIPDRGIIPCHDDWLPLGEVGESLSCGLEARPISELFLNSPQTSATSEHISNSQDVNLGEWISCSNRVVFNPSDHNMPGSFANEQHIVSRWPDSCPGQTGFATSDQSSQMSMPEESTCVKSIIVPDGQVPNHRYILQLRGIPPEISQRELCVLLQDLQQQIGQTRQQTATQISDQEEVQKILCKAYNALQGGKITLEITTAPKLPELTYYTHGVNVTGIDESDAEMLMYYFENPLKGGGNIEECIWYDDEQMLYIAFVDAKVAHNVVSMKHNIEGLTLHITKGGKPFHTVMVSGCDINRIKVYKMYFENPVYGGGPIKDVKTDSSRNILFITFKEEKVALSVCSRQHTISGCHLTVTHMNPKATTLKQSSSSNASGVLVHPQIDAIVQKQRFSVATSAEPGELQPLPDVTEKNNASAAGVRKINKNLYNPNVMSWTDNSSAGVHTSEEELQSCPALTLQQESSPAGIQILKSDGKHLKDNICTQTSTLTLKKLQGEENSTQEATASFLKEEECKQTVEISSPEILTEDIYQCFFENPRNVGGNVEMVNINKQEGVVEITFTDPKVAERVASRKHVINGREVRARLVDGRKKAQQMFSKVVLLRHIGCLTSTGDVRVLIENITGLKPQRILRGDQPENLLVIFREEPDIKQIEELCSQIHLQGRQLSAAKVPPCNAVLVELVADVFASTKDLSLYFESRFGKVQEVVMANDREHLVYFSCSSVALQVLSKEHSLNGKELAVNYPFVIHQIHQSPHSIPIPDSLKLKNINPHKIAFIQNSHAANADLTRQLSRVQARYRIVDSTLTLECLLTSSARSLPTVPNSWVQDVQRVVDSYMDTLETYTVEVPGEMWSKVENVVKDNGCDETMYWTLRAQNVIIVVGVKEIARHMSQVLHSIVERGEQKKNIKKASYPLKAYQLRLLDATSFSSKARTQEKTLKVEIDHIKSTINFTGLPDEVLYAEKEMFRLLFSVKTQTLRNMHLLLKSNETQEYIQQKFVNEKIIAVIEQDQEEALEPSVESKRFHSAMLYAFSDRDLENALHVIRQSIVTHDFTLDVESQEMLQSQDWLELEDAYQTRHQGLLKIEHFHRGPHIYVSVTGTDNIVHNIIDEVEDYIEMNAIYSQDCCLDRNRQKFIWRYWHKELLAAAVRFEPHKVEVSVNSTSKEIKLKGTKKGLELMNDLLDEWSKSILCHKESLKDEASLMFLNLHNSSRDLDILEENYMCVLAITNDTDSGERGSQEQGACSLRRDLTGQGKQLTIFAFSQEDIEAILQDFGNCVKDSYVEKDAFFEHYRKCYEGYD